MAKETSGVSGKYEFEKNKQTVLDKYTGSVVELLAEF